MRHASAIPSTTTKVFYPEGIRVSDDVSLFLTPATCLYAFRAFISSFGSVCAGAANIKLTHYDVALMGGLR